MRGTRRWAAAVKSLSNYNYRLYFFGQCVSITGTWMQRVSQGWLVLELTGSAKALGFTSALQALPYLLIGTWGGLVADRVEKRRLLVVTQAALGLLAGVMCVLVATGVVQVWMVMTLAFLLGMINSFDNPARQSFVSEMVGRDHVTNAVTLNSIATNVGKSIGPAVAGVLITAAGIAAAFVFNAFSYVAVVVALLLMRQHELHRVDLTPKRRGQVREGLRHVRAKPVLWTPLLLLTVTGLLAADWQVRLPVLAVETFKGDARTYGLMLSLVGVGAVFGGFAVAGWLAPTNCSLLTSIVAFSVVLLVIATSSSLWLTLVTMLALGAANIAFSSTAQSMLQLEAAPQMRGRVLSLSTLAQRGTSPVSAPLAGFLSEELGVRFAIGLGAVATLVATVASYRGLRRQARGSTRGTVRLSPASVKPDTDI